MARGTTMLLARSATLAAFVATACVSSTTSTPQCSVTVTASDDLKFTPANVTGAYVCWKNIGSVRHLLLADDGSQIGELLPGQTIAHTFTAYGTTRYVCVLHAGMSGTVTVPSPFFERQH
ncbi:MAG TPA: hypothetical protein VLV45_00895 [Gemmatimonadales bacterium]|nr:hypothetical protein [Gemmatimonadales bacterium]